MSTQAHSQPTMPANKYNESILVVKKDLLFPNGLWHGIRHVNFDEYLTLVQTHQEYMARGLAEENMTYKQIIPYLIFRHDQRYFLMQRKSTSSEQRLANKYSLGIGGHLRQQDIQGSTLFAWAQREFKEEIAYTGSFTIKPIGILNSEETPVDQVHVGFVLLLEGDSSTITIKSELQSGQLVSLKECKEKNLENWSSLVVEYLEKYSI